MEAKEITHSLMRKEIHVIVFIFKVYGKKCILQCIHFSIGLILKGATLLPASPYWVLIVPPKTMDIELRHKMMLHRNRI